MTQLFPILLFRIPEDCSLHATLHRTDDIASESISILSGFLTPSAGRRHGNLESAQPITQRRRFLAVVCPAFQGLPGGSEGFGNASILREHLADLEIGRGNFVAAYL